MARRRETPRPRDDFVRSRKAYSAVEFREGANPGSGSWTTMVRNQGRVTRFVVMATLQAARAETLGLAHDSALSWGLNRAIFYAAAKQGFRGGATPGAEGSGKPKETPAREVFRLGDDEAYRDPRAKQITFVIGDEDQTVEEFERSIIARFGTKENFAAAWKEAMGIVGGFDRATLESRAAFYEKVYRPRRDELSDSWTQRYSPPPKKKSRAGSA
jgi:hypothetical protein